MLGLRGNISYPRVREIQLLKTERKFKFKVTISVREEKKETKKEDGKELEEN